MDPALDTLSALKTDFFCSIIILNFLPCQAEQEEVFAVSAEKNVLVVDDEAMIRESVSAYISKQGYHVLTAETGEEALEIFQNNSILLLSWT